MNNVHTTAGQNQNATKQLRTNYAVTFLATFAGVVFGVALSLGLLGTSLKSDAATAAKTQAVSVRPADDFTACVAPTGSGGGGTSSAPAVKQAVATPPVELGRGGGGEASNPGKTVFVKKLVTGTIATTTGTNSYTGPDSTNVVRTTNVSETYIHNDNDVTVTNNNPQHASSGDAKTIKNTSGGNATSGTAENSSDADFNVSISN